MINVRQELILVIWVFVILFAVLGVVSILLPKVTRFLYSWDSVWFLKKALTLKQIRLIGVAYCFVALVLWLIATLISK